VEANNNSGGRGAGRPVRHNIPLGILIFLVYCWSGQSPNTAKPCSIAAW